MSEAEAIVEGLMCEDCGCLVDGDAPGFPRKCSTCKQDHG